MSAKIAIQLYSLRREMSDSPSETLKKLKEIGYDAVEAAGLYGYSADYIKGVCDALGIEIISDHIHRAGIEDDFENIASIVKTLGCKYVAVPWLGREELPGGEKFPDTVKFFNKYGEMFNQLGIELLFHNHRDEFTKVNGDYALDILYNSVSRDILKAEIDAGWATYMGVDSSDYIKKYNDRLPILHLKDFVLGNKAEGEVMAPLNACPVGEGELPLRNLINNALDVGCEIFVVEQDEPYGGMDSFECASVSLKNLKDLLS